MPDHHFSTINCDKCTGYATFEGGPSYELVVVGEKLGKPYRRNVKLVGRRVGWTTAEQTNSRLALGNLQLAPRAHSWKNAMLMVIQLIIHFVV